MANSTSGATSPHFYHYDPSSAAAIAALTVFFCTTVLHAFQMLRTRTWYFIPFLFGGFLECLGYAGRIYNTYQTPNWAQVPFILQELGILIAPAFLAASMYILFGRLIRLTDGDGRSFIKQKWLTAIFVTGDVISLLVQAIGGGQVTSSNPDSAQRALKIIEAGLFVQVVSFGVFILCALIFHYRITKRPTYTSMLPSNPWRKHMSVLYVTSCLIFGRCIFRVVMYIQGTDGSISSSEALFYIFDFIPVFVVMVVFNIVHPSEVRALLHGGGSRIAWHGKLDGASILLDQGRDGGSSANRA